MATQPYLLRREQFIPMPVEEVFAFFGDAGNLAKLTPPWLNFRIVTPMPVALGVGATIQYEIRWGWIPMRWTTAIVEWNPPFHFADLQTKGPYRYWHHTHRFEPVEGGTRMTDEVRYRLPLGPLGWMMHRLAVRRNLESIFDYRRDEFERLIKPTTPAVPIG